METFLTACLVSWLAVVIYVGRLSVRQRRLQQALDALSQPPLQNRDGAEPPARAA